MKAITLFGAAFLLVFLTAAAVSVYGFGQYEQAWGRGGSLQAEAWLALVGALVAMGSFGISSAVLHRTHAPAASFTLGAVCAVGYIALCWAIDCFASSGGVYVGFLLLISLSAFAALGGLRAAA